MASSPEKSQLIQEYMTLHSQQTNVRRRLSTDSNSSGSSSPSSSPSSLYNTPSSSFTAPSPAFSFSTKSSSPTTTRRHSRSSSMSTRRSSLSPPTSPNRTSIPPIPEEESSAPPPLSLDEVKLADISSRIKNTLTDLLNCEAVKSDPRMRSWVATRLMDVEHDLKEQKRRRHSSHAEDAELIASHLRV